MSCLLNRPKSDRRIVESAGISRPGFGQAIHMTINTQTPEIRITRWQWHEPMSVLYTFHWAMGELIRRYAACPHSACPPGAD
jgi:hypothetical protein